MVNPSMANPSRANPSMANPSMANPSMANPPRANPSMANPSMASTIKAYFIPLILFSASMLYQLIVIPRSYPTSHYEVLGIKMHSSIEEVTEAYEKLSSHWSSSAGVPSSVDFIKIRYAFELLTNPLWKKNYDIFGINEQVHVVEKFKEQYAAADVSEISLPLLGAASFDFEEDGFDLITSVNFQSKLQNTEALLVQVFSRGSNSCAQFSAYWKRIVTLLDGVANTGMVELGDIQLATYLAEKKSTGRPFFRNGVPSLVAFPLGCKTSNCLLRYEGVLSVDAVTDWFATSVLSLPRILYYSKESLAQNFLGKASPHKVKVIFFSKTGERAFPFVRQAAKDHWAFASFAFVLWQEDESSFWWNMFGVESAPAIVFLKDPGVKPVVYHESMNNSMFLNIMEENKHQELPQLRAVTSMDLGCDARGYSRAGNETTIWYCVVLAGRQSHELNKMRETIRRTQQLLSDDGELNAVDAGTALREKRLTFTWLDGEAQNRFCSFYIHLESNYETCGPRRYPSDVPRLFIVRYKRNATEDIIRVEKRPKTILEQLQNEDVDSASQLVAIYNGSYEVPQIAEWVSQIIKDGDSKDLPFYRTKTPELVPDDSDPIWSKGARSILSTSNGMKQRIAGVVYDLRDRLGDPRIGPLLLLGALMSFGKIWLGRSQSTPSSQSNDPSQPSTDDEARQRERFRRKKASKQGQHPHSITDAEPIDAYQMPLLSDSD